MWHSVEKPVFSRLTMQYLCSIAPHFKNHFAP